MNVNNTGRARGGHGARGARGGQRGGGGRTVWRKLSLSPAPLPSIPLPKVRIAAAVASAASSPSSVSLQSIAEVIQSMAIIPHHDIIPIIASYARVHHLAILSHDRTNEIHIPSIVTWSPFERYDHDDITDIRRVVTKYEIHDEHLSRMYARICATDANASARTADLLVSVVNDTLMVRVAGDDRPDPSLSSSTTGTGGGGGARGAWLWQLDRLSTHLMNAMKDARARGSSRSRLYDGAESYYSRSAVSYTSELQVDGTRSDTVSEVKIRALITPMAPTMIDDVTCTMMMMDEPLFHPPTAPLRSIVVNTTNTNAGTKSNDDGKRMMMPSSGSSSSSSGGNSVVNSTMVAAVAQSTSGNNGVQWLCFAGDTTKTAARVMGGRIPANNVSWNPLTCEWSKRASIPLLPEHHGGGALSQPVHYQGRVYVHTKKNNPCRMYIYDIALNEWHVTPVIIASTAATAAGIAGAQMSVAAEPLKPFHLIATSTYGLLGISTDMTTVYSVHIDAPFPLPSPSPSPSSLPGNRNGNGHGHAHDALVLRSLQCYASPLPSLSRAPPPRRSSVALGVSRVVASVVTLHDDTIIVCILALHGDYYQVLWADTSATAAVSAKGKHVWHRGPMFQSQPFTAFTITS